MSCLLINLFTVYLLVVYSNRFASISLMLGFGTSKCVVCKQSLSKRRKMFKCLCEYLCVLCTSGEGGMCAVYQW